MSGRRKRKSVYTTPEEPSVSVPVEPSISASLDLLEPSFGAAGHGEEGAEIARDLKSMTARFSRGSIDKLQFQEYCNAKLRDLDELTQRAFEDSRIVSMMEGVRECVRRAGRIIKKTELNDPRFEIAINKMLVMFEEGSVRRLAASANAILSEMRRESQLSDAVSCVEAAVTGLTQIHALVAGKRRVEQIRDAIQSHISPSKQTRRRGASLCPGKVQSIGDNPRLLELREKNAKLKAQIRDAKTAAAAAEENLVKLQRNIIRERLHLRDARGEKVLQLQANEFEKLKQELLEIRRDFAEHMSREEEKRKELQTLRDQVTARDTRILSRIDELSDDARRAKELIEMQSTFGIDYGERNYSEKVEETKREIEKLAWKGTGFAQKLDAILVDEKKCVKEQKMKRNQALEKAEEATETRHVRIEKLKRRLKEVTLMSNTAVLSQETVARLELETARCQKQQHSADAKKAKKEKQLAKMNKRGGGYILISALEAIQEKTVKFFPGLGETLEKFRRARDKFNDLCEKRSLVCSDELFMASMILSERWEGLTDTLELQRQWIENGVNELIRMEIESGKVPIDDETLSTKLAKLSKEAEQVISIAYANPRVARYDSLRMELQALQKENRELKAAITSLLADLDHDC